MSSIDQQFIEFIVKSLVGKPDEVKIDRRIDEKGVLLELTVDPEDLGRVIGKRGATAQSLRTLLRALGTKNDARYNLKIVDNGEPKPAREPREETTQDEAPREERRDRDETSFAAPPATTVAKTDNEDGDEFMSFLPKDDDGESDRLSKTRKELEELDDLDL
jgi:predicted RNA-binding protein YlqC (UPF0109 family)